MICSRHRRRVFLSISCLLVFCWDSHHDRGLKVRITGDEAWHFVTRALITSERGTFNQLCLKVGPALQMVGQH